VSGFLASFEKSVSGMALATGSMMWRFPWENRRLAPCRSLEIRHFLPERCYDGSRDGVPEVLDMQTDMAFVQALRGARLADKDRKQLDPDYLFLLGLRDVIQLTTLEKKKLSPDHLFILALRGAVKLANEDKQRLAPDDLFMLALRGIAHLTPEDKQRLSSDDLMHLQMRGI
jgi:hypothetical protein